MVWLFFRPICSITMVVGIANLWIHATAAIEPAPHSMAAKEIQITDRTCGHILTNTNVWSPDGRWIVYDTRSDPAGDKFDGSTIEIVNVETREVREIYRAKNGA